MSCRPSSYIVQSCCASCSHVFILREYDDPRRYFCHLDGSKRPPCGSVLMEEDHTRLSSGERCTYATSRRRMRTWAAWEKEHEVACEGYCTQYEVKKVTP